jgi:hypothetical protein
MNGSKHPHHGVPHNANPSSLLLPQRAANAIDLDPEPPGDLGNYINKINITYTYITLYVFIFPICLC